MTLTDSAPHSKHVASSKHPMGGTVLFMHWMKGLRCEGQGSAGVTGLLGGAAAIQPR